jgi:hypothetical protein
MFRCGLRETEIKNLDFAFRSNHQILRFKVTMHNEVLMGGRDTFKALRGDAEEFSGCKRLAHPGAQRFAFHIFHDEIKPAVVFDEVMDRRNMWIIELRRSLRFLLHALVESSITAFLKPDYFDCDATTEESVLGKKNVAHSAAAEFCFNSETMNAATGKSVASCRLLHGIPQQEKELHAHNHCVAATSVRELLPALKRARESLNFCPGQKRCR